MQTFMPVLEGNIHFIRSMKAIFSVKVTCFAQYDLAECISEIFTVY